MIEVVVSRLGMDPGNQTYVVVLQEKGGARLLPIWIGQAEAESIVMQMHNMKRERPLTHDLCKTIIAGLGADAAPRADHARREQHVLRRAAPRARRHVSCTIDSRPSDAIAIALRLDAPIFAADALLAVGRRDRGRVRASRAIPRRTRARATRELSAEQLKEYLEHLRPEDFGKFNL